MCTVNLGLCSQLIMYVFIKVKTKNFQEEMTKLMLTTIPYLQQYSPFQPNGFSIYIFDQISKYIMSVKKIRQSNDDF